MNIPGASGIARYKTSIDVLKNHLSGILVVKKTDSLTTRIVFVTELGMKMFDFEARNDTMSTVYVFDPLNKPALIGALKRNFNNMFLLHADGPAEEHNHKGKSIYSISHGMNISFYTMQPEGSRAVSLQETFYKRHRESKINYEYSAQTHTYTKITCKQYGLVKFYFELNAIPSTHD